MDRARSSHTTGNVTALSEPKLVARTACQVVIILSYAGFIEFSGPKQSITFSVKGFCQLLFQFNASVMDIIVYYLLIYYKEH